MNIERVLDIFGSLSGLSEEFVKEQSMFCEMSAESISSRLTCPAEKCGGKAEFAAAALAYYRYVLWTLTDGGAEGIKVGDISISSGKSRLGYAERLWSEALNELKGLITDEGFVFEGI